MKTGVSQNPGGFLRAIMSLVISFAALAACPEASVLKPEQTSEPAIFLASKTLTSKPAPLPLASKITRSSSMSSASPQRRNRHSRKLWRVWRSAIRLETQYSKGNFRLPSPQVASSRALPRPKNVSRERRAPAWLCITRGGPWGNRRSKSSGNYSGSSMATLRFLANLRPSASQVHAVLSWA